MEQGQDERALDLLLALVINEANRALLRDAQARTREWQADPADTAAAGGEEATRLNSAAESEVDTSGPVFPDSFFDPPSASRPRDQGAGPHGGRDAPCLARASSPYAIRWGIRSVRACFASRRSSNRASAAA